MTRLLGIDLGTSSVKAVVIDEHARVLGVGAHEYRIESPQPGWAEQQPQRWWAATVAAVRRALRETGGDDVEAVGFSGQMHGTVLLDDLQRPRGPAIIWADQRAVHEVEVFRERVGTERLAHIAGTAPATGFMGPTLLWLRAHDPARLAQIQTVVLPKDFIRLMLTGRVATEASDASSTALFDIRRRTWSEEICAALDLSTDLLPDVLEPAQVAGELTRLAADTLGLRAGLPVVAGCADQVAQAVGNGLLEPGNGSVTVGSGGQVFIPLAAPLVDEQLRLHVFCHAPAERWYLLGAMLAAGLSLRWLRDLLGLRGEPAAFNTLAAAALKVPPGAGGLIFLPYLAGERAPLMDPLARGCFVGLRLHHDRGHLARAIMEGVAFALRQIVDTVIELEAPVHRLLAVGNGLASPAWRQITADVLGRPLLLPVGQEHAGVGAALVAGIGVGVYDSYAEVQQQLTAPSEITEPQPHEVAVYDEHYEQFRRLYPVLQPTFRFFGDSAESLGDGGSVRPGGWPDRPD